MSMSKNISLKDRLYLDLLPALKESSPYFSLKQICDQLNSAGVDASSVTLKTYLSRFVSEGFIHAAGRGWYSSLSNPFVLKVEPVKDIIAKVERAFPLLDFSCWSTEQINPFMHHLLSKFVIFVDVESDALSGLADWLKDDGYDVYAKPGKKEAAKAFRMSDHTVVIRTGHIDEAKIWNHAAPIEKILVDLLNETARLKLMELSEAQGVVDRVTRSGRISMGYLLNYAKRQRINLSGIESNQLTAQNVNLCS